MNEKIISYGKTGLTFSDLVAQKEPAVLVVETIEIGRQGPSGPAIVAGVPLHDADGPHLHQYLYITYHGGWQSWVLVLEHTAQKRTEFTRGTLQDVLRLFEARVGVKLPSIRAVEFGVGHYDAATRQIIQNPWRLEDGQHYRVHHATLGRREFVASIQDGHAKVTFLSRETGEIDRTLTFDPVRYLTDGEWRSLRPCADVAMGN